MFGEEPPFLPVGTEVSAKYRGAFCEAKVKKIVRNVKCKVTLKDTGGNLIVQDEELKGNVKLGHTVEVKHPDTGHYVPCVINKITDHSTYTVVFDDGDESTLRRTQLCLKGEKHFVKSDTLDELPLTHPEHFGTPVMRGSRSLKNKRIMANASSESDSEMESSDEETIPSYTRGRRDARSVIGQVVCVEVEDRKKTMWVPALVVQPSADNVELKSADHILVKSFKDSKFFAVSRKDVKDFSRQLAMKNEDKTLKAAFEKALQYYDTHNLPQTWDKAELLGSESEDDESSEEEPSEERDRFVAQLYKFMDDRGTPMNKAPQVANRDLNLYKLFRLVQDMGGYNKVTNQTKWHIVYSKMNLPPSSSACNQLKVAYKKYLHAFEDFDRKLGCSMGTITRPRARHNSGRSLLSCREKEHESTPKSPRRQKKAKDDEEEEARSARDISDKSDVDSIKSDQRVKARLDVAANSSASDSDSSEGRLPVRESSRNIVRDDTNKSKETTTKLTKDEVKREDAKHTQEEPPGQKQPKEEEEEKAPDVEDKEESRQTKKRGRKKEPEDTQKDEAKEEKKTKRRVKDDTASEQSESKTNTDEEEDEKEKSDKMKMDYAVGMKLRIKYGKGKTIKIYEAKVVESKIEGGCQQYKVHYAGWNIRYDEWVKKDRIVAVVDESPSGNKSKVKSKVIGPPSARSKGPPGPTPKKVIRKPAAVSTPGTSKEKEVAARTASKPASSQSAAQSTKPSGSSNGSTTSQRPTRSTSAESKLAPGLPAKRRARHNSGTGDVESVSHSTDSDSNVSGAEVDEEEVEEELHERRTRSRREAEAKVYPVNEPTAEVKTEVQEPSTPVTAAEKEIASTENKTEPKVQMPVDSEDQDTKKNITLTATAKSSGTKLKDIKSETAVETVMKIEAEHVKEEPKVEKKLDDKIYDFDESSSQDSFKNDLLSRPSASETKESPERGRSRWKETGKRAARVSSAESTASSGSVAKLGQIKEKDSQESAKVTKETPRVNKKAADTKPETEKKMGPEKEKKKPPGKTKDVDEKAKLKAATKTDKVRGKRKADVTEVPKVEDLKKKKVCRKKDAKEDEKAELPHETSTKEPEVNRPAFEVTSSNKTAEKTEPALPGPSWSPNYIPAPTLTQTVNIETKSEHDVIDEPAPQLSPITSVSTTSPVQREEQSKVTPAPPQPHSAPPMPVTPPAPPATAQPTQSSAPAEPTKEAQPTVFENTPPETPEGSPQTAELSSAEPLEPKPEPICKKELLPVNEIQDVPQTDQIPGGDSPNACNTSTVSNGSGGSSGNAPGSESEDLPSALKRPKTGDQDTDDVEKPIPSKKRLKRQPKSVEKCGKKHRTKVSASDSDESEQPKSIRHNLPSPNSPHRPGQRVSKYNFLDLEEGKYLEGEERIKFLMGKIQEIRKLYMQLKSEVACIDRRRKRQRRKMHDAAAAAAAAAAVAAVVSRGEAEML